MSKGIEIMCKNNQKDQSLLLRFLSKCPLLISLLVMQRHRITLHMLLQKYRNEFELEEISYSALILAIKSIYIEEQKISKNNFKDMTLEEIKDISIRKASCFLERKTQRKKSKRDKLLVYWSTVKTLRTREASFRDISSFLKKYNKFEVSHSTIFELWKELETISVKEAL